MRYLLRVRVWLLRWPYWDTSRGYATGSVPERISAHFRLPGAVAWTSGSSRDRKVQVADHIEREEAPCREVWELGRSVKTSDAGKPHGIETLIGRVQQHPAIERTQRR